MKRETLPPPLTREQRMRGLEIYMELRERYWPPGGQSTVSTERREHPYDLLRQAAATVIGSDTDPVALGAAIAEINLLRWELDANEAREAGPT